MRWARKIFLGLVLIAGISAILYARVFKPVPVTSFNVALGTLTIEVMGTGTLQARTSTVVSPKIQGRLVELHTDQGEHVVAGDIIAKLDDSDLLRQVEIAHANMQAAEASLDRLRADRTRAQAVLRYAEREDERLRTAFEQGAGTDSEIDKSAEQVAIAHADIARTSAAIAEGSKLRIAATKTLEFQQAKLEDTVLLAPFDGMVVRRDRDPGDIVVPGSSVYRIVSVDEIWVSAWVDETALAALAQDQPARVVLRSEPDNPYPGHVVRLGRETDPETREFIVDVAIERLPEHWAIGQRAEAYIQTQQLEDVIAVPIAAVSLHNDTQGVFVVQNNRAHWIECEFGAQSSNTIEVRSGLSVDDTVVWRTDRAPVRDGQRVTIQ